MEILSLLRFHKSPDLNKLLPSRPGLRPVYKSISIADDLRRPYLTGCPARTMSGSTTVDTPAALIV